MYRPRFAMPLAVLLAFLLAACMPIQPLPAEQEAPGAASESAAMAATIAVNDTELVVPESLPAGITPITVQNTGEEWHAAIIRRLNDDVTFEEWEAVVAENPIASFPLTKMLGGPDVAPGESTDGFYALEPGLMIVVDNWVDPIRYATFTVVEGEAASAEPPVAAVSAVMSEYAFDVPDVIAAGTQLWQFENAGEAHHQMGVIQLLEGKTLDDIITWWDSEEGPPPFTDIAHWNTMSPGARSWSEFTLEPGTYQLLDFLPDFAHDGAPNFTQGMFQEITVE